MLNSIIKRSLYIVLAFTFILSSAVHALDSCSLKPSDSNTLVPLLKDTPSELRLHKGENHLELTCSLKGGGVLSFTRPALTHFSWLQNGITKPPLQSNQMAVLMEQGDFTALLNITATAHYTPRFTWSDTQTFIAKVQQYNLIFGLFYGLCATLIFYVLIIGYGIKDAIFKLYGLYLVSLSSFIFLQEGQPYLFLQGYFYESVNRLYTLSIGMTVVTATWFMSAILALPSHWPKVSCTLKIAAACVLILCLQKITLDLPILIPITSAISGYVTLLIVLAIFILSAIQAKKGVNEANLVFIALSCVFISMLFRILLPESSPFIQRFGFVIAFTLESILLAIAVGRRIQRLSYAKKQAERHANFDPLCHIYNRRGWRLKANDLLAEHKQRGGVLCFLYIDLDHFKAINDTYGHDVGDKVLCKVALSLSQHMRSEDVVGRLGGDEFVVLALFNSNEKINQRVNTLKQKLNLLTIEHQKHTISIYASVGQTSYTQPPDNLDSVLKSGDKAMYKQKLQRKTKQAEKVAVAAI
jgi:diguanylate cyclase